MTREQIKEEMIRIIKRNCRFDEMIEEAIDTDTISDFLYEKDYGEEIYQDEVDRKVENYLEDIYDEIEAEDIIE